MCRQRAALVLALGIVLLAPIWVVDYPPLFDYPNHLAGSFVLHHLNDPHFQFSRFYRVEWTPAPYVVTDLMLLAVQRVVSVEQAGRILLSLCLLALPLGGLVFVRRANPGHDVLGLWGLVIAYHAFFLLGFVSYSLSIGICFAAVGLWLRYLDRPSLILWTTLLGVVTALYFTHLMGFAVAGMVMTTYAVLARRPARQLVLTALLFLPGAVLTLRSLTWVRGGSHALFDPPWQKSLVLFEFLRVDPVRIDPIVLGALAICAAIALWKNADLEWNRPWLGVAAVLCGLYWLLPFSVGDGSHIYGRVLPFLFLLIPALGRIGRRARWVAVALICLFLLRTGYVARHFVIDQPEMSNLVRSLGSIPVHARVLPVVGRLDRPRPLLTAHHHFWAYGVIRRGWLSPYLFAIPDVQPLRLRPDIWVPGRGRLGAEISDWHRVQASYDYVWAYRAERYSMHLRPIGELIFAQGDIEVYRMNRSAAADR